MYVWWTVLLLFVRGTDWALQTAPWIGFGACAAWLWGISETVWGLMIGYHCNLCPSLSCLILNCHFNYNWLVVIEWQSVLMITKVLLQVSVSDHAIVATHRQPSTTPIPIQPQTISPSHQSSDNLKYSSVDNIAKTGTQTQRHQRKPILWPARLGPVTLPALGLSHKHKHKKAHETKEK